MIPSTIHHITQAILPSVLAGTALSASRSRNTWDFVWATPSSISGDAGIRAMQSKTCGKPSSTSSAKSAVFRRPIQSANSLDVDHAVKTEHAHIIARKTLPCQVSLGKRKARLAVGESAQGKTSGYGHAADADDICSDMSKTAYLMVRMAPQEKQALADKAKAEGMGMSDWVRSIVRNAIAEPAATHQPHHGQQ